MTKTLMITLLSLVSVVTYAQQNNYDIETIERNISRTNNDEGYDDGDRDEAQNQEEYSDSVNEAGNTRNSPQINIFNANSNANKQNQKARVQSEVASDVGVESAANADAGIGNEYISRANDIRRARKNLEVGTEQKMVEKIEWSRMEDEKDRADRLFGNRLDKKYDHSYQDEYKKEEPKVIVVEKPTYVAPVEQPAYKPESKPAPVYGSVETEEPKKNWWGEEAYIAPMVGMTNYSADNVRPDTAYGLAIGTRLDSNISLEGSFLYSELQMDDYRLAGSNGYQILPGLKDVTQYGIGAAAKYSFGLGRVSPFIGAVGTYTMRNYREVRLGNGTADSTAFDAGITLGLDVKVAKSFSLGAEYRIMKNITNNRDENQAAQYQQQMGALYHAQAQGKSLDPLEELGYQMFLVNGKFSF